MDCKLYKVYLPDNKTVVFWFQGPQLEQLLNAYNIKYEIIERNAERRMKNG